MKYRSLLSVLVLLLSSGFAAAQDETPTKTDLKSEKFSDWTVQCGTADGEKRCVMGQAIQQQVSEKAAVSIAIEIGRIGGKKELGMIITAPLGIPLPPGIQLKIDAGEPIRIPYQICTPEGCLAVTQMDTKLVTRLKKGKEAKIGIILDGKNGIAFPISRTGFSKAFNHFTAQQK